MDPSTVPPPSPPSPPYPPTDAVIEASAFDYVPKGEPSTSRNMENFKARVVKLAGRLLPGHQSLIERRFDDILPAELLVPDHPSYADMILTALWELKAEGGSNVEDISHFIEKEYHELPWAHATILNHHLRDLCLKGKITMTHDRCYIRCSSITKPKPSPSPSPLSSTYSSSSTSISTSSSSSSSSLSWGGSYRTRKRKKVKGKSGKMVQVRGRGRRRGRLRGSARGRGRLPMMVQVRKRCKSRGDEGKNKVDDHTQGNEDENEDTSMEIEDYSKKDADIHDGIAKIREEENLSCEQNNKEQYQPQKKLQLKEAEIDNPNVQSDDEVTALEVDVSDAKVDEHVVLLEPKEENGAADIELNQREENQQFDIVERQNLSEDRLLDDENLSEEQDSVMMHHEARLTSIGVEKQHVDTFEERNQPDIQVKMETAEETEPNKQLDCLTEDQVETKEQSADLHDDDNDDVTEEPLHPQEHVEKTEDCRQSCKQDQLKNVEGESAEQEEQQTEVNQKEIMLAELQQEQFVEVIEQQNQPCIQQTEVSEQDSLQGKNNPVKNEDMRTSGSTTEGSRRPLRQGLRSSSKKEDAAPKPKKQLELVTPVRRSLRSHKTISEAAVITEVSEHSGRTRSSKRKLGVAVAEQVSNTRKTRRTGL